ncbi:MAG: metallophosphoesterase family protein [Planctomycetota bacterium]
MPSPSPASNSDCVRIAVLGDVHGNLEALQAVLAEARALGATRIVQTGDVVGYGPDPGTCLEILRESEATICLGNHDAAVLGTLSTDYFNPYARAAVEWTRQQLTGEQMDELASLPLVVEDPDFTLVHGSLHEPAAFGYVASVVEAEDSLRLQSHRICFVGHTHVPGFFGVSRSDQDLQVCFDPEFSMSIGGFEKSLVNVGSVGQPRDEDPRAAFVLFEPEQGTVRLHRVRYDLERTQQKILAAGLPTVLADRLRLGV